MTKKETAKRTKGAPSTVQAQVAGSGNVQAGAASIHQVVLIRNRFVYRALQALTWLTAAMVILWLVLRSQIIDATLKSSGWLRSQAPVVETGLFMYFTGILATGLSLVAFQLLARRVPQVLVTLWKRNIIASRSEAPPETPARAAVSGAPLAQPPSPRLEAEYHAFLGKSEDWLNHRGQWLMGALLTLLVVTWERDPIRAIASSISRMHDAPLFSLAEILFGEIIQFLLAFMVGLLIWRMGILGVRIWRLGKVFAINPQLGHPDACGGLEPLGNLCLWNALIVGIAGVFLGGWIILAHVPKVEPSDPMYFWLRQALGYSGLFSRLILIPIAVAAIGFFVPLWSIHQAMQARRSQVQPEMDQLAQTITEIEQTLLEQADTLPPQESEDMNKKLKMMQEVYARNRQYPVWPFNVKTLAKLASSQIVPLLVALGLSDNIADVIRRLLELLAS